MTNSLTHRNTRRATKTELDFAEMDCQNCGTETEILHRRGGYWACQDCADQADTAPRLRAHHSHTNTQPAPTHQPAPQNPPTGHAGAKDSPSRTTNRKEPQ